MGSTICTAAFPSAAIASSYFIARCVSIWYGFFIATPPFPGKRKLLLAHQGFERGVATFYDLPGIPQQAAPVRIHNQPLFVVYFSIVFFLAVFYAIFAHQQVAISSKPNCYILLLFFAYRAD
jgi:hypothetical protein